MTADTRSWSLIGSVWVHLLLLVAVRCPDLALGPPAPGPRPVELVSGAELRADRPRDATGGDEGADATAEASGAGATPRRDDRRLPAGEGGATEADRRAPDQPPAEEPAEVPADPETERDEEPREPPPEEEPAPPEAEFEEFVRVEEEDVPPDREARHIGQADTAPEEPSRSIVREKTAGELTPRADGATAFASAPSLRVSPGDPADPMGRRPEVSDEQAEPAADAGGGGHRADATGAGAPGTSGDRRRGGPGARRSGGSVASAPAQASSAPEADAVAEIDLPAWWHPTAILSAASPHAPADEVPRPALASPTDGDAVALRERQGTGDDRGGTRTERDEEALPTEPAQAPGLSEGEGGGASDPVADLRTSLGWGGVDRSRLRPRAAHVGMMSFEGALPTSPQTVADDDVALALESRVHARETPVGDYTERIYAIIQELWYARDLDPHARALGIQGNVTVEFLVHRHGRVSDLQVVKPSGHTEIDRLALQAVPERLPRFPRDLERHSVRQRITFKYRNHQITADTRP